MKIRLEVTRLGLRRLARVVARMVKTKTLVAGAKTALARAGEGAHEEGPSIFAPEVMLPLQYYEAFRRKHLLEGEKALMFAVLEDAVEGYQRYLKSSTKSGQTRFREAEEWIDREDKLWLFSFNNVCEALDIDPEYMRRGLHQWKQKQLERTEQVVTARQA
jgi:hypothetical protein